MRQRANLWVVWVTSKDQRNHFQNVIVEHKNDKLACLTKEDWIWGLFLVVEELLTDIASWDHFNPLVSFVETNESDREIC